MVNTMSSEERKIKPTLIEKMGGIEAASGVLVSAVEIFYAKIMAEPRLSHFFDGVEMERIKKKQVEFLAFAFGGPDAYTGRDLFEAHERLIKERGLSEWHFDVLLDIFRDTLTTVNLPSNLVEEAVDVVNAARPVFQGRGSLDSSVKQQDFRSSTALEEEEKEDDEEKSEYIALQIEHLIHNTEKQLAHTRSKIRVLLASEKASSLKRVRKALEVRDPGLVELFDGIVKEPHSDLV